MKPSFTAMIIDDEPSGINTLKKLLQINCPEVEITGTCTNADLAIQMLRELKPQMVFLDIAMPVKTGFDIVREVKSQRFEIIFVTAHNQFMIEAFHFSAIDYLLKPVEDDLLVDAVSRAKLRISEKFGANNVETLLYNLKINQPSQKMKLCIPSFKGFQVIDLDEIIYAESSGNYTNIYFTNKPMVCTTKPMHEYEALLQDAGFARIHKSILVNLLHVKEYIRGEGGSIILSTGQILEVSRRKKESFLAQMKAFYKF